MAERDDVVRAADEELQFRADLPWIGPLVGATFKGVESSLPVIADSPPDLRPIPVVKIAGAVDPALRKAFAAAFVPVIAKGTRFRPAGPDGREQPLVDVYWLKNADRDRDGWFCITNRAERWGPRVDGVLVVLLYNESRELAYYTYADVLRAPPPESPRSRVPRPRSPAVPAPPLLPLPNPELVRRMVAGIVAALQRLLDRKDSAKALRRGLSRIASASISYPDEAAGKGEPAGPADDASGEIVFALASCQYPSGLLEEKIACASYARLVHRLDTAAASATPQCLLLVGDQIYVDGTAGLFDPTARFDRYVRPYEILFRLEPLRDVLRRLPAFMMLDDHEIIDNWEPRVDDVRPDTALLEGRRSYLHFQRRVGPREERAAGDSEHPLWCRFAVNGFPFFFADTRTERQARTARGVEHARIMSNVQFLALFRWLRDQNRRDPARPKFIVSPSILLPRHLRAIEHGTLVSALRGDGWDGYPWSQHRLLAFIARARIRNVIFLSGDEHLACVARATITPPSGVPTTILSVHSSALFAPFPFANSERADLADDETFSFASPRHAMRRYTCEVRTRYADEGDGFAVLRVWQQGGHWKLSCDFDRETVSRQPPFDYAL